MSNLPERLRTHRPYIGCGCDVLGREAADEIERLRAENKRINEVARVLNRAEEDRSLEIERLRGKAGFEIKLTPEIMEDARVMQEALDRDLERIRDYLNSSPPPDLFGGLQSRNNETGESK